MKVANCIYLLCVLALVIFDPTCIQGSSFVDKVVRARRAVRSGNTKPWKDGIIPYKLPSTLFSGEEKGILKKAMKSFEDETCVQFREYVPNRDETYVEVANANRCYSNIGMGRGRQRLLLAPSCRTLGMIMHEMSHTIGLVHELSRPDREKYVDIFLDNIQPGMESEFRLDKSSSPVVSETGLDFQSITLYHPSDFSRNGKPTYFPKASTNFTGPFLPVRYKDLSFEDVKAINLMYQCDKKCPQSNSCPKGAFRNKNCVCITAEEYARRRCQDDVGKESFCQQVKKNGECFLDDVTSSYFCRRTCGRCFRAGKEGDVETPPMPVCLNADEGNCKIYAANGFCFFDQWTVRNCQKICGTCVNYTELALVDFQCRDHHNPHECQFWARDGLCQRDRGFMLSSCARSCNACQPLDNEISHSAQLTRPCRNVRSDVECEKRARKFECSSRPEAMFRDCPLFCGQCPESGKCEDLDSWDICSALKERNLCTTQPARSARCRKSCGLCSSSTQSSEAFRKTTFPARSSKKPQTTTSSTRTTKTPSRKPSTPFPRSPSKTTAQRTPPIPKVTQSTRPSSTTRQKSSQGRCSNKDRSGQCKLWASVGHCAYNYVKTNCRRSCGFC